MIEEYRTFVCDRCNNGYFHVDKDWEKSHIHSIKVHEHSLSGLPSLTTDWQICDNCLRELNDFLCRVNHDTEGNNK